MSFNVQCFLPFSKRGQSGRDCTFSKRGQSGRDRTFSKRGQSGRDRIGSRIYNSLFNQRLSPLKL